ncbi:MAG: DUF4097 family beta strand repeat-containing protein [Bdellovibrionales bacterium]
MKSILIPYLSIMLAASLTDVVYAEEAEIQKSFNGIRQLKVSSLQGQTRVVGADTSEVTVHIQKRNFSERCDLTVRQEGETLNIEVSKGWLMTSGVYCDADITLTVPATLQVRAYQAIGMLTAQDLSGPFSVKSPSARLILADVSSKEVRVEATSGEVELLYKNAAPGRIAIDTTSSSVRYRSPEPTKVTFSSISGRLRADGKPIEMSASSEIEFSSVSGSFIWE